MYAAVAGLIIIAIAVFGLLALLFRGSSNGPTGGGTGSDTRSIGDDLKDAGRRNRDIEAAERRAADLEREQAGTIERAGRGNKDAQELVQKAKHILHSAKRTD